VIPLTDYAGLLNLDLRDAIAHADECGFDLCTYSSPVGEGEPGVTVEEATAVAGEDPALVYLLGEDEQSGVGTEELATLHREGFAAPVLLDLLTGWIVSYPVDEVWGVTRCDDDEGWHVCHAADGRAPDDDRGTDLDGALRRAAALNDGSD